MPTQKQLRWIDLRVGLTVLFAMAVLIVLIMLMSSTTGLFTPKRHLKTYFNDAEGLRVGAPVRLQGVDVGNVASVNITTKDNLPAVEVVLKVSTKFESNIHKDTIATLETAGVLGETFVNLDSTRAHGPMAKGGDVLPSENAPGLQDVVKASQTTLQNVNKIVEAIQSGQGSIGKFIYDPSVFNKLNATIDDAQKMVRMISSGKGTVGKLLTDDEMYRKLNASVDKLNKMIDEIDRGQGTVGKLIKDPSLYNNANQTMSKANALMDDVNQGKGALGKFAKDPEFAAKLDRTMNNLAQLTDKMNKGEGTVGKLFNDASVYNNADQMLVETRNLVKAIRENPKKYLTIHFKLF
jgi:phospholipid/cholesterol/gamma-HCH transport system substrate-binding protein